MKMLIVNADDFGLHPEVNRAIIVGHSGGCVTSASIMPGGAAFADAVRLAADHPALGVGVHLTLVAELPVSDPAAIPTLVGADGRLASHYPAFIARLLRGAVSLADVRTELTAQVAKAVAAGIRPTHLDSHQHLHVLPGVADIVLDIAAAYHIPAIRIPGEPFLFTGGYPAGAGRHLGRAGLSALAAAARRKARRRGLAVPDHFFGMLAGGNLREEYLLAIIDRLPDGVSEIMTHPGGDDAALGAACGWGYSWQAELAALTSGEVTRRIAHRGIKLVTFRELAP